MTEKDTRNVTEWLSRPITGRRKGAIFMTSALLVAALAGALVAAPGVLAGEKGKTATTQQDCGCPANDSDFLDIDGDNNTINIIYGNDSGAGDGTDGGGDGGAGDGGGGDGGTATAADLELSKTVDDDEITAGDTVGNATVQFTVQVTNTGPDTATGVVVSDDTIAANLSDLNGSSGFVYVNDTESQGDYDPTTGTWTVGSLESGDTATLTIEAAVIGTDETIENVAQVAASDQPDPDSTPGNDEPSEDDQDSATVTVFGTLDAPTTLGSIRHPSAMALN